MKIGVISDTHDSIQNLQKALTVLKENKAEVLIHCGDLCAPFMIEELAKFSGEVHCIFGNIDDKYHTPIKAKEFGINFHGDLAELEIAERKIAVTHFPIIAHALASTGRYDAVFYGHTHTPDKQKIGKCLLLNPGEVMGRKNTPSIAIYNPETNNAEILQIE